MCSLRFLLGRGVGVRARDELGWDGVQYGGRKEGRERVMV